MSNVLYRHRFKHQALSRINGSLLLRRITDNAPRKLFTIGYLQRAHETNKILYCIDNGSRPAPILGRKLNRFKVQLQLKPDANLFFKPFALKPKVDKALDKLIETGILKCVNYSDYATPITPVLKSDGTVRVCGDYSVTLNKVLHIDRYPLPRIEELFARLHGGKEFSKLDLSMAHMQLELTEDSQPLTCINTHRGLFQFTRLVFGLSSAPAIFQKTMERILAGIDGICIF
ncbi:Uncharacterized protein K02A2.6 [Eumeta japonica]|uniref:Uncharacterized protein K02A2.6 n=1 Tax=Eumeta variegata TaxID=151549 RepID=A0A4C2ABY3_EUMVA|nr:Uncharacterized protein K02A2.6 [Eumeta japonica]